MTRTMPEIIEVNAQQLEELLARAASNTLREEDTQLIRQIFDSYVHLFELVGDKNTAIARLRKLFFGVQHGRGGEALWRGAEAGLVTGVWRRQRGA